MARPSIYSEQLVNEICERISLGESLRSICRDDNMPDITTIMDWLNKKPEFSQQYTRARVVGADSFEDKILEAAESINPNNANAIRVKADILFKLMGQRNPKKYNERHQIDANVTQIKSPKEMTEDELKLFVGNSNNR